MFGDVISTSEGVQHFDLCSAHMAVEEWHGTSVYNDISVKLTPVT